MIADFLYSSITIIKVNNSDQTILFFILWQDAIELIVKIASFLSTFIWISLVVLSVNFHKLSNIRCAIFAIQLFFNTSVFICLLHELLMQPSRYQTVNSPCLSFEMTIHSCCTSTSLTPSRPSCTDWRRGWSTPSWMTQRCWHLFFAEWR